MIHRCTEDPDTGRRQGAHTRARWYVLVMNAV
jgi:hypothetical protein